MSRLEMELLQWFSLLAGGLAFVVMVVFGYGVTVAACYPAGSHWGGVSVSPAEITLTAISAAVAFAALVAAIYLFRALLKVDEYAPGPIGRLRFFAMAAILGNVLFLGAILLQGLGALNHLGCTQA
jgi:hypothetical protein